MMDEKTLKIRRAHLGDVKQLAKLHFICASEQPGAFMHLLGRRFFVTYYKIILKDPSSVVLCADADQNGTVGFVSATFDSKRQLQAIIKERFKLFWAAIPALIRRPSLIQALYIRDKSCSADQIGEGFLTSCSNRICYWGWMPGYPSKGYSTYLLNALIDFMEDQGAEELQMEVDRANRKVEVMHRLLGAKAVKEFVTKDGRLRVVMEYRLKPQTTETKETLRQDSA